jgi:hypothetical protein
MFEKGQWYAIEHILAWLNTLEELNIPKKQIYKYLMEYRPRPI